MLCFDVLKSVLTRTCLICVLSLLTHVCSKVCVLMCVLSLSHVLNCGFPFVVLIPLSCVSALESVLSSVCLHACALTCACSPVSVLPSCVVNFVCSPMCSRVCVCVCQYLFQRFDNNSTNYAREFKVTICRGPQACLQGSKGSAYNRERGACGILISRAMLP